MKITLTLLVLIQMLQIVVKESFRKVLLEEKKKRAPTPSKSGYFL